MCEVYLSNEHSTSSEGSKMAERHKSLVNRLSMVSTKALRSFGGDIRSYSARGKREIKKMTIERRNAPMTEVTKAP